MWWSVHQMTIYPTRDSGTMCVWCKNLILFFVFFIVDNGDTISQMLWTSTNNSIFYTGGDFGELLLLLIIKLDVFIFLLFWLLVIGWQRKFIFEDKMNNKNTRNNFYVNAYLSFRNIIKVCKFSFVFFCKYRIYIVFFYIFFYSAYKYFVVIKR